MESYFSDNQFFIIVLPYVREALRLLVWIPFILLLVRWARLIYAKKETVKPFAMLTAVGGREHYDITAYETSVGRMKDSDIVLNFPFISRNHAVIAYRNEEWFLFDTGSSGGVSVNGTDIKRRARLKNGDTIGFSGLEFIFSAAPDKSSGNDIYSGKDIFSNLKKLGKK